MAFEQKSLDDYVDVAERVTAFRAAYPEGTLAPADPAQPFRFMQAQGTDKNGEIVQQSFVVVVAAAYRTPDDPRPGVGMAWEIFPGRTPYTRGSELQNAETSAWGRAIIAVGASDSKRGIASRDEVRNRQAERDEVVPRCMVCFHMRGSHFREGCDADGAPGGGCGCKQYMPLPVNRDGSLSRSQTSDEEKAAAGVMTDAQQKEHNRLERETQGKGPQGSERLSTTPVDDPWYDAPAAPIGESTEDQPGTVVKSQLGQMHKLFGELEITDREERLQITRNTLGLDMLHSSARLSYRQAQALIGALQQLTREQKAAKA